VSAAQPILIPKGFRASAVKAGIKPSGNLDLAILAADAPCTAAGSFTTNRIAAAPVRWDKAILPSDQVRGIVINAGNANAATGAEGLANAMATAEAVANGLDCATESILVASTGVIGHQLPMEKVRVGVSKAIKELTHAEASFRAASEAILTTDTRPKLVSRRKEIGGTSVRLLGLCKGAAMIGPKMATMLGFLLTDARVDPADLAPILGRAVEGSFNCISVEGHESTNDTVLLLASGESGGPHLKGADLDAFAAEIESTCVELARMIPGDGEGATHRITIDVEGARDREEARTIARAVADSPLVKTAIHGADPNWGRIVSAAGYSGVPFEESELSLELNGVPLYKNGVPLEYDAAKVSANLKANRETAIRLTLTRGSASIRFWTCDLTAEYVRLNADYTT
jgi:glutamate N-acetyltransferase / amino-acid N-acetyltransferase